LEKDAKLFEARPVAEDHQEASTIRAMTFGRLRVQTEIRTRTRMMVVTLARVFDMYASHSASVQSRKGILTRARMLRLFTGCSAR